MTDSLQNLTDSLSELNKQTCNRYKEQCNNCKRHDNIIVYRCKKCKIRSYKSLVTSKERFSNVYAICNK